MAKNNAPRELRGFVCAWLRYIETKQAKDDEQKLHLLHMTDDDELLKKWLWTTCVIGGPVSFILCPLLLSFLKLLLPVMVIKFLWLIVLAMMAVTFILFVLTMFLTVKIPN